MPGFCSKRCHASACRGSKSAPRARYPAASARGFAAGVGDVKVEDKQARKFEVSTSQDLIPRAGQWKLLRYNRRRGTQVEIEQVMADPLDDGRGARLVYRPDGTPVRMDIRVVRNFRLLFSGLHLAASGLAAVEAAGVISSTMPS